MDLHTYDDGYAAGYADAYNEIAGVLAEPRTDDPVDLIAHVAVMAKDALDDHPAIAATVDNYAYFNDKGQWVPFPQVAT